MIKKLKVTISKEHHFICDTNTIGRIGENECVELEMTLYEPLKDSWVYLDFISPDGSKYKTPRLEMEDNIVRYAIPNSVLTKKGLLSVQMVVHNEAGVIWATNIKEFYVKDSINAVDEIEKKEDFITEAQKLLDEIKNGGTSVAGGVTDVKVDGVSVVKDGVANIDLSKLDNVLRDVLEAIQTGTSSSMIIEEIEQLIVSYFENKTIEEVEE